MVLAKTYEPLPQYAAIPSTKVWRLTCSGCGRVSGWGYDPDRNMWVCGVCHRPSYTKDTVEQCENCDLWYVVDKIPDEMLLCRECATFMT